MKIQKYMSGIVLIFLLSLMNQNTVLSQTVVDTLYRHPDTTTFYNLTITVIEDVSNLAIKYRVNESWDGYFIEKIIFVQPDGVDTTGFEFITLSLGEWPEDTIIYQQQVLTNNPTFPLSTELVINPPIYVEENQPFFISGSGVFIFSISDYFEREIPEQYAFFIPIWTWIENVPCYFNVKVVVRMVDPNYIGNEHESATFQILQNYPNPFNTSTSIKFNSPVEGYSELFVYDLLGIKRKNYSNKFTKAGLNIFKIDSNELTSGVYFYRIKINNQYSSVMKMIVLK